MGSWQEETHGQGRNLSIRQGREDRAQSHRLAVRETAAWLTTRLEPEVLSQNGNGQYNIYIYIYIANIIILPSYPVGSLPCYVAIPSDFSRTD